MAIDNIFLVVISWKPKLSAILYIFKLLQMKAESLSFQKTTTRLTVREDIISITE